MQEIPSLGEMQQKTKTFLRMSGRCVGKTAMIKFIKAVMSLFKQGHFRSVFEAGIQNTLTYTKTTFGFDLLFDVKTFQLKHFTVEHKQKKFLVSVDLWFLSCRALQKIDGIFRRLPCGFSGRQSTAMLFKFLWRPRFGSFKAAESTK